MVFPRLFFYGGRSCRCCYRAIMAAIAGKICIFAFMLELIQTFLTDNIHTPYSDALIDVLLVLFIALVAVVVYFVARVVLGWVEHQVVRRTSTTWDDDMLNGRFLSALSQLAPALVVRWMLPGFFAVSEQSARWLGVLTSLYIVGSVVYIFMVLVNNLFGAFERRPELKRYAVRSFRQTLILIVLIIGILVGIGIVAGRSPLGILTAFGATAGVMMLVFRDTILGFVASVQLTANNMLRRGDWIVCDRHGANGEVLDITLTTVKVRNWDNSVSTIPPYSLISDSFRNYAPMLSGGGRRVERQIFIDVNSVRFCSEAELEELSAMGWLEGLSVEQAGRTVNLNLLRRYLERYLATHPALNHDMLAMVRQMEPTPSGLPLQLYFFTSTTVWKEFEGIQSDIFDHVYASVGLFGLRIFQTPAGADLQRLR